MRGNIRKFDGYEVEGEDCNFVVSFSSAASAVEFGAAVQAASTCTAWDDDVVSMKYFQPVKNRNSETVLNGPRLQMGMCSGTPARVQACLRTGRMEYFGTIMVRRASMLQPFFVAESALIIIDAKLTARLTRFASTGPLPSEPFCEDRCSCTRRADAHLR